MEDRAIGKGSNTTTQQSSTSANPQAAALYSQILQQAQGVASTPYQAYSGQLTAPVNAQQTAGINSTNANAGFASPYIQQAGGLATGAANPLTQQQIQNYQNPYTQDVVNAMQAQFNNQNAQQQAALKGNQISQGALGGNRTGIAASSLAGQQQLAQAPTIANLYAQSYNTGLGTAAQQYQQNPLAAAGSLANFGISGQNAALQGAGQQIQAGTLQQQTQQAQDTALYNQYVQQQAYPFQTAQWLAGLGTAVGPGLGTTTQGTTTGPAPNQTAQYAGLGLTAAGLLLSDRRAKRNVHRIGRMNDGQPLFRYQYHGSDQWHIGPMAQEVEKDNPDAVHEGSDGYKYVDLKEATDDSVRRGFGGPVRMAVGGTPWSMAEGWVPTFGLGNAAPRSTSAPSLQNPQSSPFDPSKIGNLKASPNGIFAPNGMFGSASYGGGNVFSDDAWGGSSSMPAEGLSAEDYGGGFARGGFVNGFADGGMPTMDDRFAPIIDAINSGDFDPQGANATDFRGTPGIVAANRGVVPLPVARADTNAPIVAQDDDDDETPAAATPTQGVGLPSPVSSNPAGAYWDKVAPSATDDSNKGSGIGLGYLSPNAQTGLLSAGLGMLASRSPFLGNAVGEGGLAGLSAYGAANAADVKARQDAIKQRMDEQRVQREAAALAETIRHNKASEAKEYKPTWGVISENVDPNTGLKNSTYGWIDPNKKVITDASGKPVGASSSPAPTSAPPELGADGKPLTGEDWAATVPQARADRARMIANYEESPADLPTRGGVRAAAVADAKHFNKDYNEQNYQASQRAYTNFVAGPEARSVRSLNVATDHLDTLRQAGDALNNGNLPLANSLMNKWREATGSSLPTNFDSIKQAVSSEIAKVVVGGQTALADRDEMSNRASNAQSPEQLHGIFDGFTKLMGGQMKGLRQQYEAGTYRKDFDRYLLPATRKAIAAVSKDVEPSWESPKGPDPGMVKGGYRFKGGDPSKKENWEKV